MAYVSRRNHTSSLVSSSRLGARLLSPDPCLSRACAAVGPLCAAVGPLPRLRGRGTLSCPTVTAVHEYGSPLGVSTGRGTDHWLERTGSKDPGSNPDSPF